MVDPNVPDTPCGWLIEALLGGGTALGEIESFFDEPVDSSELDRFVLPTDSYHRLFEWAAERLGDPLLGLHVAATLTASSFGLLGYLLENSATLGDWLENFATYHRVFAQDAAVSCKIGREVAVLDYQPIRSTGIEPAQDILLSLGAMVHAIRLFTKTGWSPSACQLTIHPGFPPEDARPFLCDDLRFGADANRIMFPAADLSIPIPDADPVLFSILRGQADRILKTIGGESELINRLRLLITANISDGQFGVDDASGALNMSVRKLHRELSSRRTSYRKVRDDVVHEMACAALSDTDLQITEIAHKLGYSETSAFTRAFQRVAGQTPRAYRTEIRK